MNLLPCPFCGGKAIAKCIPYERTGKDDWWVSCVDCRVERPSARPSEVVHSKDEAIAAWNRRAVPTLDGSSLLIVRKALQRYRMRIEEVGAMGWYDNPEVTRQEVARVDAILAQFEQQGAGEA